MVAGADLRLTALYDCHRDTQIVLRAHQPAHSPSHLETAYLLCVIRLKHGRAVIAFFQPQDVMVLVTTSSGSNYALPEQDAGQLLALRLAIDGDQDTPILRMSMEHDTLDHHGCGLISGINTVYPVVRVPAANPHA